MSRLTRQKELYDLNKSFSAVKGDGTIVSYTSQAANSLVLWTRMSSGSPTNLSDRGSSVVAYNGSPQISENGLDTGHRRYPAATFADVTNRSAQATSSELSFSTAPSGGTPDATTDLPFSISLWFNLSDSSTINYLFGKTSSTGTAPREYGAYIGSSTQKIIFKIEDESNSNAQEQLQTIVGIETDRWYHAVFTYDGRGGNNAHDGLNLYLNGELYSAVARTGSTSYLGMAPNHTGPLLIGEQQGNTPGGGNEFDGMMGEFCAWKNHELTAEEVSAIYHATKSGKRQLISGVSSVPVRLQLRERDQIGGKNPINKRVGDRDSHRARHSLPFDDTNTISFLSNFATAKIRFGGKVQFGEFFDITSSMGDAKSRFKLVATNASPGTFSVAASDITVPLLNGGESISSGIEFEEKLRRRASKRLAKAIKDSSLKIDTIVEPTVIDRFDNEGKLRENRITTHTITLRHRKAGTGSFSQGNLINVSAGVDSLTGRELRGVGTSVSQFDIGTSRSINLSSRIPLDGNASSLVSVGHSSPDIVGSGSVISGISDANYIPATNYSITPFDESRIPFFENPEFDDISTPKNILEGFNSPLSAKTILKIKCKSANPDGDTIFYASGATGDTPVGTFNPGIQGKIGSGFAYWNNILRQWEMKGLDPNHEEISPFAQGVSHRAQSCVGFTLNPSGSRNTSSSSALIGFLSNDAVRAQDVINAFKGTSMPTNTYGFPRADQYNATSSQEILMSDHISGPFLLEKIKVQVKGVFGVGTGSMNTNGTGPINKTFFILNQRTSGDQPHVTGTFRINNFIGNTGNTRFDLQNSNRPFTGNREVVTWGKLGFIPDNTRLFTGTDPAFTDVIDDFVSDYDLVRKIEATSLIPSLTASLNFNIAPKLALQSDMLSVSTYKLQNGVIRPIKQANTLGGAGLDGNASGRQIASSLGAVKEDSDGPFSYYGESLKEKSSFYLTSPYLLFPNDRLIIGWQNLMTLGESDIKQADTSQAQGDLLSDKIQEVDITMFGSLIRRDREFHDTLNQNLSTGEIQELIFGEHILDQFDLEPLSVLSGSTSDALFFGRMILSGGIEGVRGRRASIAKGEAGSTGSLQRNIQFKSKGRHKDSLAPHLHFFLSNPNFFSASSTATSGLKQDVTVGANSYPSLILSNNPISSSFKLLMAQGTHQLTNPSSGKSFIDELKISPASNYLATPGGGNVTTANFLSFDVSTNPSSTAKYLIYSGTKNYVQGVKSFGSPEIAVSPNPKPTTLLKQPDQKIAIASIFAAAPIVTAFGKLSWPVINTGDLGLLPFLRGCRHGFSNPIPVSPKNYFRRSSFGQFRDMMEQAPETAVVSLTDEDTGKIDLEAADGPVRVRFFARNGTPDIDPHDTNSQNLSQFATSSLPYFDGLDKERDVVNFPPPDNVDKIDISEALLSFVDGDA